MGEFKYQNMLIQDQEESAYKKKKKKKIKKRMKFKRFITNNWQQMNLGI